MSRPDDRDPEEQMLPEDEDPQKEVDIKNGRAIGWSNI